MTDALRAAAEHAVKSLAHASEHAQSPYARTAYAKSGRALTRALAAPVAPAVPTDEALLAIYNGMTLQWRNGDLAEWAKVAVMRAAIAAAAVPSAPTLDAIRAGDRGMRAEDAGKLAGVLALTLTGHQLRQALQFVQADDSPDALDVEVRMAYQPAGGEDQEGEPVDAGIYVWLAEYPDEGAILLDGTSLHDEAAAVPSAEPVAWPAKHVSLLQQKTRKLHLTLELDNVEGWPNYWVMRSDARGRCSTQAGCSAHGCHGECLSAPQPAAAPAAPVAPAVPTDEALLAIYNGMTLQRRNGDLAEWAKVAVMRAAIAAASAPTTPSLDAIRAHDRGMRAEDAGKLSAVPSAEPPKLSRHARFGREQIIDAMVEAEVHDGAFQTMLLKMDEMDRAAPQPAAVPSAEPADDDFAEKEAFYAAFSAHDKATGHKPSHWDVWLMARGLMGVNGKTTGDVDRKALEDECARTDSLLTILGLEAERCRTEGGSLQPQKVLALLGEAKASAQSAEPQRDWKAEFGEMQARCADLESQLRAMHSAEPVALPHPGSPEASAMMDSVLAEYEWPANPKNAARAGYEAARRLTAPQPAAVPDDVRTLIEAAWCAGYWHNGYTNDGAYAERQSQLCADELLSAGAAREQQP